MSAEIYSGCDIKHECEPIFCHVCTAHFMAWRAEHEDEPEWGEEGRES